MKKVMGITIFPLVILALFVAGSDAISAGRVSLGSLSIEAPQGWALSTDGKRIVGKPAASGKEPSKEWYSLSSELFVMVGPETDPGRDLSATLEKFMGDTFIGYDEIGLKSFRLNIPGNVENLGFSGSMRNRSSGDVIYAVVMVLRHGGERYFFVYDIDREDRFVEFSKGPLVQIMNSMKTGDGPAGGGKK